MTFSADNWRPTPELLAAYFDGEFEGRDDLSLLKQRIEEWIAADTEAQEQLANQRRLLQIWHETTPPEPAAEQWASMFARLEPMAKSLTAKPAPPRPWSLRRLGTLASVAAALAGVVIYLTSIVPPGEPNQPAPAVLEKNAIQVAQRQSPKDDDEEILPVAHANEVTIVHVEGADAHTLVVGQLPLQGLLELVAPGDVVLTLIRPDANEVNPVRFIENSAPMIWAKLDSETDD